MNLTQGKKDFSKIGLSFLIGIATFYVIFCFCYAAVYRIKPDWLMNGGYLFLNFGLMFVLAYPLIMFLMKRVETTEIPKKKIHPGMVIALIPMCYTTMILFNILGLFINYGIGLITGNGIMNPIVNVISGMSIWTQIIIVVIIGPIFEELVFRKFVMDRVYKYGEFVAVMTSALMFGLFHGNMQQFIYAFGAGFLLAFVYCKSGNVIYTIICHMSMNFLGSLPNIVISKVGIDIATVQRLIASDMNEYMRYVQSHILGFAKIGFLGLFILMMVIAGIVLMIVFHKKLKFERRETDLRGKAAWGVMFINTGMALYVIWWIVNIVMVQMGYQLSSLLLGLMMKFI